MRNIVLAGICVLSGLFSIYYHGAYQGTEHAATYNGFALMFALEALLSMASLLLYRWGRGKRLLKRLLFWTSILAFPVLMAGLVWVVYFLGSIIQ